MGSFDPPGAALPPPSDADAGRPDAARILAALLYHLKAFAWTTDRELRVSWREGRWPDPGDEPGRPGTGIGLETLFPTAAEGARVRRLAERALAGETGAAEIEIAGRSYRVQCLPSTDDEGGPVGTLGWARDVSELRSLRLQAAYQATHDPVTGLANRAEFESRLGELLERSRVEGGEHTLCYLDLDQFQVINDVCGHAAGDELLRQLAGVLRDRVREEDVLARLGGDEFGLLLFDHDAPRAQRVADRLLEAVRAHRFAWGEHGFELTASAGLVPLDLEGGPLPDVLSAADAACFVAKDLGRNRVHVFEIDDIDLTLRHGQMRWLHGIREALDEGRLELWAQEIRALGSAQGLHTELLLRLRERDGEIVYPASFLPAAERYHLMPALDRWVVGHALGRLAEDPEHLPDAAINLSGQSLAEDAFLPFVLAELERSGVAPGRICFEITETAVISHVERALHFLAVLHERGCRFALDDFGSGLSSFGYLKQLPVEYLKIDGGFVREMTRNPTDRALVESIHQIGRRMGMKTVAEFVEDEITLATLREIGVDFAQGWAVGRPRPLEGA